MGTSAARRAVVFALVSSCAILIHYGSIREHSAHADPPPDSPPATDPPSGDPPSGDPSQIESPAPPVIPARFKIQIKPGLTPINITDIYNGTDAGLRPSNLYTYLKQQFSPVTVGGQEVFPTSTSPSRVRIEVYARAEDGNLDATMQFDFDRNVLRECSTSTDSGLCVEVATFGSDQAEMYHNARWLENEPPVMLVRELTGSSRLVGFVIVRNAGGTDIVLDDDAVKVTARSTNGSSLDETKSLSQDVPIKGNRSGSCSIDVTGRVGQDFSVSCNGAPCHATAITHVQNGSHVVTVIPHGVTGSAGEVKSVEWTVDGSNSGGPDPVTGEWNVPVDRAPKLQARATLGNNQVVYCAAMFQALGTPLGLTVGAGGDCEWFESLKEYYLTEPALADATTLTPRNSGWNAGNGLKYPGLNWLGGSSPQGVPAVYAKTHAEVPAAGVLELGARKDCDPATPSSCESTPFFLGPNGETSVPPVPNRKWAALVIVAYVLGADENSPNLPIYYDAIQDTSVFPRIQLHPTGNEIPPDPNTQVGLFAYLAASSPGVDAKGNPIDNRGSASAPYWLFAQGDKPIFALESSCSDANRIGYPVVSEKGSKVPVKLASVGACLVTTPMKLGDLQKGLGRLILGRHVPQYATEKYDPRLFLLAKQGPCVPSNPDDVVDCLQPGQGAPTSPFYAGQTNAPCQYIVPHTATATATGTGTGQACWHDSYGRRHCYTYTYSYSYTYTYTWYETKYRGNCTVQKVNRCAAEAALRFASYEQGRMLAAACFLKYDKRPHDLEGTPIAPVLMNQGISPLTATVGGSVPLPYTSYPDKVAGLDALPSNPDYGGKTGVGCAPCLLRSQANAANVKNVVADFDAPTQRQPLYTFTWSKAARECSTVAKVDVAIFGSDQCVGVPNSQFMCGSNNVPASTTCPGSPDETVAVPANSATPETVDFRSGGNYYVRMRNVRFCPGSIQSQNAIVSASPLLLDIAGKGIQISRTTKDAVRFDIYGKGEKHLVDWPVNTSEIAFLARPGADGKITSIRHLFGDNKAKNGFEALKKLDSNKDSYIDRKDKAFSSLRLWFDRDRNGIAEKAEIATLAEHGVSRIWLKYNKPIAGGIEGKTLNSHYLNTKAGETRNIEDHWFYLYGTDGTRVGAVEKGTRRKK